MEIWEESDDETRYNVPFGVEPGDQTGQDAQEYQLSSSDSLDFSDEDNAKSDRAASLREAYFKPFTETRQLLFGLYENIYAANLKMSEVFTALEAAGPQPGSTSAWVGFNPEVTKEMQSSWGVFIKKLSIVVSPSLDLSPGSSEIRLENGARYIDELVPDHSIAAWVEMNILDPVERARDAIWEASYRVSLALTVLSAERDERLQTARAANLDPSHPWLQAWTTLGAIFEENGREFQGIMERLIEEMGNLHFRAQKIITGEIAVLRRYERTYTKQQEIYNAQSRAPEGSPYSIVGADEKIVAQKNENKYGNEYKPGNNFRQEEELNDDIKNFIVTFKVKDEDRPKYEVNIQQRPDKKYKLANGTEATKKQKSRLYLNGNPLNGAYGYIIHGEKLYVFDPTAKFFIDRNTGTCEPCHAADAREELRIRRSDLSADWVLGIVHHSSIVPGEEVSMGGEILTVRGYCRDIDDASGHFLPTTVNASVSLEWLVERRILLDESAVTLHGAGVDHRNRPVGKAWVKRAAESRKRYPDGKIRPPARKVIDSADEHAIRTAEALRRNFDSETYDVAAPSTAEDTPTQRKLKKRVARALKELGADQQKDLTLYIETPRSAAEVLGKLAELRKNTTWRTGNDNPPTRTEIGATDEKPGTADEITEPGTESYSSESESDTSANSSLNNSRTITRSQGSAAQEYSYGASSAEQPSENPAQEYSYGQPAPSPETPPSTSTRPPQEYSY